MKDKKDVIREFNDIVNMTASELEVWLKSNDSRSAGWPKEDGSNESVGHGSGRNIVEILESNPEKAPDKYTDEQVQHMRKVVSYCKRHLAQEEGANAQKSAEEVKETKSYASLKNWGHDPLKKRQNSGSRKQDRDRDQEPEEEEEEEGEEGEEEDTGNKAKTGGKRKKTEDKPTPNKKRETRQSTKDNDKSFYNEDTAGDKNGEYKDDDEEEDEGVDDDEKAEKGPKAGDTVSWKWGGGNPTGKVLDVKGGKTSITTQRGNTVSRNGKPDDPAVVLDTGKSKVVKANHELS
ncbi:Protein of unknown function (DUF3140) [Geosmithia morbida]|uniref:Hypervirulence associated protein TUDOR domain-containing protein n=1 Tax=Geosmithia morbida TaxID=1094350 RepID=A0A9P4Z0J6_9HYPO|nr:Protein of unknown function (DUF3140) [Geosmithia morbida]KAF4126473.1 Protein of unknown function (DUF3140) [Geosmithia morbida]